MSAEADARGVMRALRERIAERRARVLGTAAADECALDRLAASADVWNVPLGGASVPGRALSPLRRALRRLLAPILGRQAAYNEANAAVVADLVRAVDVLADQQARTLDAVAALRADVDALAGEGRGRAAPGRPR